MSVCAVAIPMLSDDVNDHNIPKSLLNVNTCVCQGGSRQSSIICTTLFMCMSFRHAIHNVLRLY